MIIELTKEQILKGLEDGSSEVFGEVQGRHKRTDEKIKIGYIIQSKIDSFISIEDAKDFICNKCFEFKKDDNHICEEEEDYDDN